MSEKWNMDLIYGDNAVVNTDRPWFLMFELVMQIFFQRLETENMKLSNTNKN